MQQKDKEVTLGQVQIYCLAKDSMVRLVTRLMVLLDWQQQSSIKIKFIIYVYWGVDQKVEDFQMPNTYLIM